MYTPEFKNILTSTLDGLRAEGLYKEERFIASQQYSQVTLKDGRSVINMCANNYLGLANNPEVMEAAKKAIDQWGFGMASVRFICGTQTLHRQLEERLTQFLGTEDTILFPSCFDANGGLFEGLLTADDAIISDSLNHASIIDGVRLCRYGKLCVALAVRVTLSTAVIWTMWWAWCMPAICSVSCSAERL